MELATTKASEAINTRDTFSIFVGKSLLRWILTQDLLPGFERMTFCFSRQSSQTRQQNWEPCFLFLIEKWPLGGD